MIKRSRETTPSEEEKSGSVEAADSPIPSDSGRIKRLACGDEPSTSSDIAPNVEEEVRLSMLIKWSSMGDAEGRTKVKVNRLGLKELENINKLGESKDPL